MKSARAEQVDQLNTTLHRVEYRVQRFKHDSNEHAAELALDEKAIEYQQSHPKATYSEAFEVAMQENPDLKEKYIASFGKHKLSPEQTRELGLDDDSEDNDSAAAGSEIDRLAMQVQREHPSLSYESCLGRVRESHPELWKKYAGR